MTLTPEAESTTGERAPALGVAQASAAATSIVKAEQGWAWAMMGEGVGEADVYLSSSSIEGVAEERRRGTALWTSSVGMGALCMLKYKRWSTDSSRCIMGWGCSKNERVNAVWNWVAMDDMMWTGVSVDAGCCQAQKGCLGCRIGSTWYVEW